MIPTTAVWLVGVDSLDITQSGHEPALVWNTQQITLQSSASTNVGDYGAEGPIGGANVLRPTVTSADFATANIPRIWLRSGV